MTTPPPPGSPIPPDGRGHPRRAVVAALAAVVVGGFIALLVVGLTVGKVDTSIDSAIAKGKLKEAPDFTLPVLASGRAVRQARWGDAVAVGALRAARGAELLGLLVKGWTESDRSGAMVRIRAGWRYEEDDDPRPYFSARSPATNATASPMMNPPTAP